MTVIIPQKAEVYLAMKHWEAKMGFNVGKAFKSVTKGISKTISSITGSLGKGLVDSVIKTAFTPSAALSLAWGNTKELEDNIKRAAEKVTKPAEDLAKKAGKTTEKVGKNLVKSAAKTAETAVSGTAKLVTGDIKGAVDKYGQMHTNLANVYTLGTGDFTGRKEGIVNVNTPRYAKTALNMVTGKVPSGSTGSLGAGDSYDSDSGRLLLRKGKKVGGGSMFLKAKNPLGGATGQAGK